MLFLRFPTGTRRRPTGELYREGVAGTVLTVLALLAQTKESCHLLSGFLSPESDSFRVISFARRRSG